MIACSDDSGHSQWDRCRAPSSGLAQRNCSCDDGDRPRQGANEIDRQGHQLMYEVGKNIADPTLTRASSPLSFLIAEVPAPTTDGSGE